MQKAEKASWGRAFIEKMMEYIQNQPKSADGTTFDFIAPNGQYFKANIPQELIGENTKRGLVLGPDYVMGGLRAFYWLLYKKDLLNDEKCGDLIKYKFGLH